MDTTSTYLSYSMVKSYAEVLQPKQTDFWIGLSIVIKRKTNIGRVTQLL